ncbi:MAG: type II secretion system F family protein [Patescibacteria group bacterium]
MKKGKVKKSSLSTEIALGGVKLLDKATFAKHLATLLKAGIGIVEALDITYGAASGKMKKVIGEVRESVAAGNGLAASFAEHPKVFTNLLVHVTEAGELSGTLVENLENIATQLQKEYDLHAKIKSAMTYPIVVLVAAIILALAMAYYVLPQITPLFAGLKVELPLTTRIVLWFSDVMRAHGGIIASVVVALLIAIPWVIRKPFVYPFTHWVLLRMPLFKTIVRDANITRYTLTLGLLLKSGLNVDEALRITQSTVPNYYYQKHLHDVLDRVQHGGTISEVHKHDTRLFTRLVISMIRVGEESGTLDETLLYLATFYDSEVEGNTKRLTTALEPIMLVIIGAVVATLALAIITPIYEITGNIRR